MVLDYLFTGTEPVLETPSELVALIRIGHSLFVSWCQLRAEYEKALIRALPQSICIY